MKIDGTVVCWGENDYGQLGDGTTSDSGVPVEVSGLPGAVKAVGVGYNFSCALTELGGVWCWGNGSDGGLGGGNYLQSLVAQAVTTLGTSGTTASISVGTYHACAVTAGGAAMCWGNNQAGQIGNNTLVTRNTPAFVSGLSNGSTSAISAGGFHTCAVSTAGAAKCWGDNSYGQLGEGVASSYRKTPVAVKNLSSGVASLDTGFNHTCAVMDTGALKCWGDNPYGALGDGTTRTRFAPVSVSGFGSSGAAAVSAGDLHTCAVTMAGEVKCWGWNAYGQLGDGSLQDRRVPVSVPALGNGVASVSAGGLHSCALSTRGALRCWGSRSGGRVGDGAVELRGRAGQVDPPLAQVASEAAGFAHSCAVAAGGVWCWGDNSYGQLGDETFSESGIPVAVVGLGSGVSDVVSGDNFSCARLTTGTVWCWGQNGSGQLGDGSFANSAVPVQVYDLSNVIGLTAGSYHACAIVGDLGQPALGGEVRCWGENDDGQLGTGSSIDSPIPQPIVMDYVTNGYATKIDAGYAHTCAGLGASASCWGRNSYGQIGDGTYSDRLLPVLISGTPAGPISSISVGDNHSCAVWQTPVGTVIKCWGDNSYGQLGTDINTAGSNAPLSVDGLGDWTLSLVAAGGNTTCVAKSTGGQVRCWGDNSLGQLGDGTATGYDFNRVSAVPLDVVAAGTTPLAGAGSLGVGAYHVCAGGGTLLAAWCWGSDQYGQLGDGGGIARTPVAVYSWTYVPASPTALVVTVPSTTSASVAFTPNPDDGGSAVSTYAATCTSSNGGTTRTGSNTTSPVSVTSLTTGKIYTCTVIATNAVGNSAASAPSAQFVPAAAPTIASFIPTSVNKGADVTISGSNFAPGATCKFHNNVTAPVCIYQGSGQILTSVPSGAVTGPVKVITAAGTATSSTNVTVGTSSTAPTISFFTPATGKAGDVITISGNNLAGATAVKVGTVTVNSGWTIEVAGQISLPIPAGANSGTVAVTTVGGTATTTGTLTVYVTPSVTSFTPTTEIAGRPITITGTGLLGTDAVSFNGTTATPTSVTATSVSVVVPRGATTGKITVTNPAGSGTSSSNFTPIRYAATQVAAGTSHACALVSGGSVRCWGLNTNGQLGDGTTTQRLLSVPVTGLTGVGLIVAGGAFTCALLNPGASGTAKCWGLNTNGQLGNGSTTQSLTPVTVTRASDSATLTGIANMVAGTSHACALMEAGSVYCWGLNSSGQLGDSFTTQRPRAVQVVGPLGGGAFLTGVAQIAARGSTTCAQVSGAALCWGLNGSGQVGDGTITNRPRPTQVTGLTSNVVNVAVGGSHACAVLLSTEVRCWGLNTSKQLGDGTTTSRTTPVAVKIDSVPTNLTGVSAIVAGTAFTCALLTSEKVRCWGANTNGQLGIGTSTATATFLGSTVLPVTGAGELSGVRSIAAGGAFVVALAGGDAAEGVAWGLNTNGQLGDNTLTQRLRPVYTLGF